jgi:adenylate cyclase
VADTPLEIERRYRLASAPSAADLAAHGARTLRLEQVYLAAPPGGRRIRRTVDADGRVECLLTRKRHLRDLVREEVETAISEADYQRLLGEADPARRVIRKTRHVVPHGSQRLEIDVFDVPAGLVIVEVELGREDEPVELPAWLGPWRDVSADARYANANLALRDGRLPDD